MAMFSRYGVPDSIFTDNDLGEFFIFPKGSQFCNMLNRASYLQKHIFKLKSLARLSVNSKL